MHRVFSTVAGCLLLSAWAIPRAWGSEQRLSATKSEEWEDAATLREQAAAAQQVQADQVMAEGLEKSRGPFADEERRRVVIEQAAETFRRAGDLYLAAAANLDRAADNWLKAVAAAARVKDEGRERAARQSADEARRSATDAIRRAASAFEQAALWFGENGANRPHRSGEAAERAAACRERLAER